MSEQKSISAKNLNFFFLFPAILSVLAILSIVLWGLKPGIDLSGGALLQESYVGALPTVTQIETVTAPLKIGEVRVQPSGANAYAIRTRALSNDEKVSLENALNTLGQAHEDQYTSVGPIIGAELLDKGLLALGLVTLCIILFIAFAFRHVSKPVASWKYGVVVIITLAHDILVPTGVFALLGHINGAEVDSLFIVGLLTILGISINDTIVVFDRVRENLAINEAQHKRVPYDEVVGSSIVQTIARSNNTSLTVVIMLAALYFVGPVTTQDFALTLIIGMVAGTYSSIFLAAPLLVFWEKHQKKS
ncbi:MAG TPA: protein translocase subunit SecF [Candidatus Paceibacterota bacterium]|nr:protein translocase subunit SecF [Candidatus Paceibacterota bacterium]